MKQRRQRPFPSAKDIVAYQKGQSIYYHGSEAEILELKPVFTIIIKDEQRIICGNVLINEINLK